jgi:hypothetical protein
VVEWWSAGVLECWSAGGELECWSAENGVRTWCESWNLAPAKIVCSGFAFTRMCWKCLSSNTPLLQRSMG